MNQMMAFSVFPDKGKVSFVVAGHGFRVDEGILYILQYNGATVAVKTPGQPAKEIQLWGEEDNSEIVASFKKWDRFSVAVWDSEVHGAEFPPDLTRWRQ